MKRMLANILLTGLVMASMGFGLIQSAQATSGGQKNIVETAVAAGSFKTLATALQKAGLVNALQGEGPFTVFAPTDEAFARLPEGTLAELLKPENKQALIGILTYHVASGDFRSNQLVKRSGLKTLNGQQVDLKVVSGKLIVDHSTVTRADIECSNGVIHVIDQVLLPSSDDILTTAAKAGSFKTLATAIRAAGLVEALKGEGPFTVFAPTDKAFAKLPKKTLNALLQPENRSKLVSILKYHVAPGRLYASDVVQNQAIKTLQGASIQVNKTSSGVRLNSSNLVGTDVDASNGVIHIIDSVLMPPATTSKVSPAKGRLMIAHAINRGAPLYNHGNPHACMMINRTTAMELLDDYSSMMPNKVRTQLHHAVQISKNSHHNVHNQAWALRHALDAAYRVMPPLEN